MNDGELKQRLAHLPVPAADVEIQDAALRESLRAFRAVSQEAPAEVWTWRDWLWPSPMVWSGFAFLWLVIITHQAVEPAATTIVAERTSEGVPTSSVLLARDDLRTLLREFHSEGRVP